MPYLIGFLLAIATAIGARRFDLDRDRAFYAALVPVVGTYDVVFALMDGRMSVVLFEVGVVAVLAVVMVIGYRTSLWWIAGGLAAHGILDGVHGSLIVNRGIPAWWPPFCATFDVVIAVVLGAMLVCATRRQVRDGGTTLATPAMRGVAVAALLAAVATQPALGQDSASVRARPAVAFAVAGVQPVGALGDNIDEGYGATASFLLPVTRSGSLSVRFDVGVLEYGHEEMRTPFSESVGGRVDVDVHTSNLIVPASVGVLWAIQRGAVRPYVTTGIGAHVFYTESRVEDTNGGSSLASTVNQSDVALAWMLGTGIGIPVSEKVQVDIGATYSAGGRAEYLAPGSIVDLPGGGIAISRMESRTDMVMLRIGARISL